MNTEINGLLDVPRLRRLARPPTIRTGINPRSLNVELFVHDMS